MPVNRKETIGDPNSFKDINYELLIDFRLTVDGYLHNTPPVKEYSWEEFQELTKKFPLEKEEYFLNGNTFEQTYQCLILGRTVTIPFRSRSYFSPLTEATFHEIKSIFKHLDYFEEDKKEEKREVGIIGKVSDKETKRITKQ